MKYFSCYITSLLLVASFLSCSYSKKFTTTYYQENDSLFHSIQQRYKKLYEDRPFSVGIKDRAFRTISFEILTDSIKYVYELDSEGTALTDTLQKYEFDTMAIKALLEDMKRVHCTWITNLDYYENRQKKYLVFLSIRHKKLKAFLRSEKYFTLAFFNEYQHYDERGRLLDNEDSKKFHKINGALFRRIDDRICYSMSPTFR